MWYSYLSPHYPCGTIDSIAHQTAGVESCTIHHLTTPNNKTTGDNMEEIIRKGYKATLNGSCRKFKYEVGKTYKMDGAVKICERGFHYCVNADDVFNYYDYINEVTTFLEIEAVGNVHTNGDKSVTDEIKIVREIPLSEWNNLFTRYKFNKNGDMIYHRTEGEEWVAFTYDDSGEISRYEKYNGFYCVYDHDLDARVTKCLCSTGYWETYQYNKQGKRSLHETPDFSYVYKFDANGEEIGYDIVQKKNIKDSDKWERQ